MTASGAACSIAADVQSLMPFRLAALISSNRMSIGIARDKSRNPCLSEQNDGRQWCIGRQVWNSKSVWMKMNWRPRNAIVSHDQQFHDPGIFSIPPQSEYINRDFGCNGCTSRKHRRFLSL